jgi:predicted MPP superfamily phosphohydrolase
MLVFWLIFIGSLLVLGGIKLYALRGVKQGLRNKRVFRVYAWLSILSYVGGITTMICAFYHGMVGMKAYQNLIIGTMFTFIICELIMIVFFLLDDTLLLGKWIRRKAKRLPRERLNPGRRRFIKTTGVALTSIPFVSFLYGITIGKYNFRVLNETLSFSDLPDAFDGFKILQFSDLHSGSFDSFEDVERGFAMIKEQAADLILFTGDLVNDVESEVVPYKGLLKDLQAEYGKFSVLGNHDYSEDFNLFPDEESKRKNFEAIHQHHADVDFHLMNNVNHKIEKDGDHIRLIGVENWGNGFIQEGDLDKAIVGCEPNEFSVLMSHDPTHWEQKVLPNDKHIHLTLAGHTHGMQMGVEIGNFQWSPIQYFYKRWAGLYQELNQYLYVNRGFGFIGFAGRVGIPPEITVITLKKA